MMTTNTLTEFLTNPTNEKLEEVDDKVLAVRLLRTLDDTSDKLFFFYKRGEIIDRINLFKLLLKDNRKDRAAEIIENVQCEFHTFTDMVEEKLAKKTEEDLDLITKLVIDHSNNQLLEIIISDIFFDRKRLDDYLLYAKGNTEMTSYLTEEKERIKACKEDDM